MKKSIVIPVYWYPDGVEPIVDIDEMLDVFERKVNELTKVKYSISAEVKR